MAGDGYLFVDQLKTDKYLFVYLYLFIINTAYLYFFFPKFYLIYILQRLIFLRKCKNMLIFWKYLPTLASDVSGLLQDMHEN